MLNYGNETRGGGGGGERELRAALNNGKDEKPNFHSAHDEW